MRRRRKRGTKFKISFIKFILPLSLLFVVIILIWTFRSSYFSIKHLDINLEKINCTDREQIEKSSNILGKTIFFINSIKIENDLKKQFICISRVDINKNYPSRLKLSVFGREAVAVLVETAKESTQSSQLDQFSQTASSSGVASASADFNLSSEREIERFLVDNEGIVYSKSVEQMDIPIIYTSEINLILGQKINQQIIINSLKILDKVKSFGIMYKESKIYSENILLLNGVPKMIFRLDNNISTQLASLQLILEKAKIDQVSIEFIDLRFDKPVVKFAPKNK